MGLGLVFLDEVVKLFLGDGLGEIEALYKIASERLEQQILLLCLNALCHYRYMQIISDIYDKLYHAHILVVAERIVYEVHIYLECVDRHI